MPYGVRGFQVRVSRVLSRREIDLVFANLAHPYGLVVKLLYGCGLRLFECLGLRIGDIDIDGGMVVHDVIRK